MIQLELFPEDEVITLRLEVQRMKETTDKMRKALFARHGDLAKHYLDIHARLEVLEKNICHTKTVLNYQ